MACSSCGKARKALRQGKPVVAARHAVNAIREKRNNRTVGGTSRSRLGRKR